MYSREREKHTNRNHNYAESDRQTRTRTFVANCTRAIPPNDLSFFSKASDGPVASRNSLSVFVNKYHYEPVGII